MSNPMDSLLRVSDFASAEAHAIEAEDGTKLSYAIVMTDGSKPGDGTVVTVKAGRYAHDTDVVDPDAQAAYERRQRVRTAILEWFGDRDSILESSADGLTDDVLAAVDGAS